MEKGNTRDQILAVALTLFSERGFEATSISQIADAVGIRKASLYSHFESKKDILDSLIQETMVQFEKHSLFTNANWEDPEFTKDKHGLTPAMVEQMIKGQIRYIIHDPQVSKVRKMLTIEQYQNENLKLLQTKQSYEDVLRYNEGFMRFLVAEGILKDEDPAIMAAQMAWPISIWTSLCDREPERETEVMQLLERHIQQFFRVYGK